MVRQASVERKTGETSIAVTLNLDVAPGEKQAISVSTGVGFLDHVSSSSSSACRCGAGRNV